MFFLVFNRLDPNWPPDQAPSFMGAPEVLIERLNRGVRGGRSCAITRLVMRLRSDAFVWAMG
jgi:hypothetical protein